MLVVVSPAASTRLTTPGRAREMLGLSADAPSDQLLGRMIDDASRVVSEHCRTVFAEETIRETFVSGAAVLSRDPVSEVISVTANGAVIAPGSYVLDGDSLRVDGLESCRTSRRQVVVEYRAGYVLPTEDASGSLPPPIERATTLIVGAYISTRDRDPLVKSEDVEGVGSVSYWMQGARNALPSPEAESLLAPFKRSAWRVG